MDLNGSGPLPFAGLGIGDVETLYSITIELVT
jgi:hypothetical protein